MLMESIREEEGQLTADLLLDKARDGSNVLHSAFEWNDSKAGHMYRTTSDADDQVY